ncbi:MAG: TolC family protein [Heteroscytonema crispum UTEX LB 1556]
MKGQQLFHSFLPGVTVAVLSTQPAWADMVKVSGVGLVASPNVSTSTYDGSLIADIFDAQLPHAADNSLPVIIPTADITDGNKKPLISNSIWLRVTGKTGVPIAQIPNKYEGNEATVLDLKRNSSSSSSVWELLKKNRSAASNQQQSNLATSGQKLQNQVVPASTSSISSVGNQKVMPAAQQPVAKKKNSVTQLRAVLQNSALVAGAVVQQAVAQKKNPVTQLQSALQTSAKDAGAAQQPVAEKKKPVTQLQTVSQATARGANSAKLLQVQNCSQEVGNRGTRRNQPIAPWCPTQNITGEKVAQTGTQTPTQTPPATVTPAPAGATQPPDYLNPSPNPLQFPTKPEEVRVQGIQPITLEQALELARRNNRDLQVALLELERGRAGLREAQAALFPSLSVNANVTRQDSASGQLGNESRARSEAGLPPNRRTPSSDTVSTGFNGEAQLRYNLYTSGSRQASIRASEEQVRVAEFNAERLSEEIRLNVSTDYYNLQQADENVRITQAAVTNAQASLRDAQALERAGVGTRFDVLRSQVNLANAQQDLTRAVSDQQVARRQLATRLSLAQSVNVTAADPVRLAGLWNQTLEDSIVQAFQNRPELQQQLAQRNISEQRRRLALSELGPQVSLVASYQLLDQFNDSIAVTDGYSLGVSASLNLFDGGAARARADQERANIAIAETQFAEQRNQIRFQVERAYSELQSNLQNVQTANAALDQAREALRLARLRFQAGVGTQTDVINSETDLTRSEGNRVRAILDYNRALANLQRSVTSTTSR